jgi:hypothetical protein
MMPYDMYREVQIRREEIRSDRIAADIRRGQFAAAVSRLLRPRAAHPAVTRRVTAHQYDGG